MRYHAPSIIHRNVQLLRLLEEAFADVESHYMGLVAQQGHAYQRRLDVILYTLGALGEIKAMSGVLALVGVIGGH